MSQDISESRLYRPRITRMLVWQIVVVVMLTIGYSGYYFCRSNFSVCLPQIGAELVALGLKPDADSAKEFLGILLSMGTLVYAVGKFVNGTVADFLGGSRFFVLAMVMSVGCTFLFAFGQTLPVFTLAWLLNRGVQSGGWPSLMKVSARWFAHRTYGTVVAVISMSFLLGDAAARAFMGWLLDEKAIWGIGTIRAFDWREVFLTVGAILAVVAVLTLILVRESPVKRGLSEPSAHPDNVYGERGEQARPDGLWELVGPMITNPFFLLVCGLSIGATLLRESFINWTPTFYQEELKYDPGQAARLSSLFPLVGAVSVILAGVASDLLGRSGRAMILTAGMTCSALALTLLATSNPASFGLGYVGVITFIAFALLGPYSFLGGAIALDFGGKRGAALACGMIDGIGYFAGVLADLMVAFLSSRLGWPAVFGILAGVAGLSAVVGLCYWLGIIHRHRHGVRQSSATHPTS